MFIDKTLKLDSVAFVNLEPIHVSMSMEIDQNTQLNVSEALEQMKMFKEGSDVERIQVVAKSDLTSSKNAVLSAAHYLSECDDKSGYVELGDILEKVNRKVGDDVQDVPVMSITMHNGLIDQGEKFKKRIATTDISKYKLVLRNELVVGFPIDEGVLGFQTRHDKAAVSPAYDVWKLKIKNISVEYLENLLRSEQAISIYRRNIKGTANRRRVVPKDLFMKIRIPIPDPQSAVYKELSDTLARQNSLKKQLIETRSRLKDIISHAWGEQ